eukprot:2932234-Prymnesium_polylepis.1
MRLPLRRHARQRRRWPAQSLAAVAGAARRARAARELRAERLAVAEGVVERRRRDARRLVTEARHDDRVAVGERKIERRIA